MKLVLFAKMRQGIYFSILKLLLDLSNVKLIAVSNEKKLDLFHSPGLLTNETIISGRTFEQGLRMCKSETLISYLGQVTNLRHPLPAINATAAAAAAAADI